MGLPLPVTVMDVMRRLDTAERLDMPMYSVSSIHGRTIQYMYLPHL